jgi:citrate synthase
LYLVDEMKNKGSVEGKIANIARAIEAEITNRKGKIIPMNIDGATAVIYGELGFPPALARGVFCLSRSVGILAHAWEQSSFGERNKGPMPRSFKFTYDGLPLRRL